MSMEKEQEVKWKQTWKLLWNNVLLAFVNFWIVNDAEIVSKAATLQCYGTSTEAVRPKAVNEIRLLSVRALFVDILQFFKSKMPETFSERATKRGSTNEIKFREQEKCARIGELGETIACECRKRDNKSKSNCCASEHSRMWFGMCVAYYVWLCSDSRHSRDSPLEHSQIIFNFSINCYLTFVSLRYISSSTYFNVRFCFIARASDAATSCGRIQTARIRNSIFFSPRSMIVSNCFSICEYIYFPLNIYLEQVEVGRQESRYRHSEFVRCTMWVFVVALARSLRYFHSIASNNRWVSVFFSSSLSALLFPLRFPFCVASAILYLL